MSPKIAINLKSVKSVTAAEATTNTVARIARIRSSRLPVIKLLKETRYPISHALAKKIIQDFGELKGSAKLV